MLVARFQRLRPRKGDNLFTCSIRPLHPDKGTYKWHFQNSPHDVWDYRRRQRNPLLVDIERDGKKIKALVQAHCDGYFYCLDRETGEFIYGKPFCEVTWTHREKGRRPRPEDGPAVRQPRRPHPRRPALGRPGAAGGKEWNPIAYHPGTGPTPTFR